MAQMRTEYLIIGAGISGLTTAAKLADRDFLLLEKDSEIGGYCRTTRRGDYVWDYAGHFFHFKTEEFKKTFHDAILESELVRREKNTKILYKGALIDYPFQTNIHQLPKDEFIDSLYDLFNREQKESYTDFADMLYGKFGKSIVEKFLRPYNEKLYACDLHKLDQNAMGRFFPYADIPQIIANMKREKDTSYNSTFLYPKAGAQAFLDILYRSLPKERVKLGTQLVRVDRENRLAYTAAGDTIAYRYLINTSPLNHFLTALGSENALALRDTLSYNKVLVFNLGFAKKSAFDEHWIYVPDPAVNYYRIGFYDNILGADKLSMYIEIGYPKDAAIDTETQLRLTLENLERAGITRDNPLVDYQTIIMDPAYVHITHDSERAVAALKESLAAQGIYTIGRYGAWTYCSMEDCMIAARDLVKTIR